MTDSKHDKDATKWLNKFNEMVNLCQSELKKTTVIGKKMLSASLSNTTLKETYEEIGRRTFQALESGELEWNETEIKELTTKVEELKQEMEKLESEVQDIKMKE